MRFNKNELIAVASLPSNKFEKEGVLLITEKQEGFFRRTEGEFRFDFIHKIYQSIRFPWSMWMEVSAWKRSRVGAGSSHPSYCFEFCVSYIFPPIFIDPKAENCNPLKSSKRRSFNCIGGVSKGLILSRFYVLAWLCLYFLSLSTFCFWLHFWLVFDFFL